MVGFALWELDGEESERTDNALLYAGGVYAGGWYAGGVYCESCAAAALVMY